VSGLKALRPSPALVVGVIAIVLAIGGTATAALSGKDKRKVKSIADQEISAQAPGIADDRISRRAPALSVANADRLGGVAADGYEKGGGHIFNATATGQVGGPDTQLLDIPGIGQLLFNCPNAFASTPKLHNSSGVTLTAIGQTQIGPTASQDPLALSFNNGDTLSLASRMQGSTTVQLWDATSGKTATITFSSSFCGFTASAVTNQ
jgi:hypothetical protein